MKSNAEVTAAKEAGLEWVHDRGFVDSRDGKDVHYRYIATSEKQFYVPHLEWHARKHATSLTHL